MAEADSPLDARVLTLLRELPSGDVVRLPVADPSLASVGSRDGTLEEQLTFLGEYLATIPAPDVARFLSPPGASLLTVDVELAREDLSRRSKLLRPVSFRVVIVPAEKGTWAFVPRLSTVLFLAEGEPLEPTLRAEISRLVAANDPRPTEWLSLLPSPRESLEVLSVPLERPERNPGGRGAALHRRLVEATKRREALEILESVGRPLHARVERGARLVGREVELSTLTALLGAAARQSVVLVGRERVGKSALIQAWLRAERAAGRPRLAFATSGAELIAGMSGLGQWQERLRRVLDAAHRLDAVLVFEDLGELFGDESGARSVLPTAMLRPWIQEGKLRVLGELTPEALTLFEPRDVGFFAGLARLRIEPLDAPTTRRALEARRGAVDFSPEALTAILDLVDRYQPYRPLPGKAVALQDEILARAEERPDAQGARRPVSPQDVLEAFSASSGIPQVLLRDDRALLREEVGRVFRQRLVGQEEAIRRVIDTICVVKAGLQPTGKPLATFLFVGPTGVGKTELARTLAGYLFGNPERLIRFDMSEFADPLAADRLFRGIQGTEGLLTRQIRQQPFSVLLLDELEKAHSGVFDLLLQVTGEGRLTDARGHTAYFHNTIVIMTSNLGASSRRGVVGMGRGPEDDEAYYVREVERSFRPEFVNRIDRIIAFAPLTEAEVELVAHAALRRLGDRRGFAQMGVTLEVSLLATEALARSGYSPRFGARALRRAIEDEVIAPAAQLMSAQDPPSLLGKRLRVTRLDEPFARVAGPSETRGALRFQVVARAARVAGDAVALADLVSRCRVEASAARSLGPVTQLRESLETLVAQLTQGRLRDPRQTFDTTALQRDHHALSELWERAERPYEELVALEELTLAAYLAHEDAEEASELAARALDEFRRALSLVLLAEQRSATVVTLRVRELDDARSFDHWLPPFFEGAEARGWAVTAHVAGDGKEGSGWPRGRYFGPPRPPREARERLVQQSTRGEVLLCVRGPWCGALLGLEAGLHRLLRFSPTVATAHLMVRKVAERDEFADEEWSTLLGREPPDARSDHSRRPAVRILDRLVEVLSFPGGEIPSRGDLSTYWRDLELVAYFMASAAAREEEAG